MSDDAREKRTLSEDDIVTTGQFSRRVLLTASGVAIGAAALGARSAQAQTGPLDAEERDTGQDAAESDTSGPEHGPADRVERDPDGMDAANRDECTAEGATEECLERPVNVSRDGD